MNSNSDRTATTETRSIRLREGRNGDRFSGPGGDQVSDQPRTGARRADSNREAVCPMRDPSKGSS
jgi:hypothetical protein